LNETDGDNHKGTKDKWLKQKPCKALRRKKGADWTVKQLRTRKLLEAAGSKGDSEVGQRKVESLGLVLGFKVAQALKEETRREITAPSLGSRRIFYTEVYAQTGMKKVTQASSDRGS